MLLKPSLKRALIATVFVLATGPALAATPQAAPAKGSPAVPAPSAPAPAKPLPPLKATPEQRAEVERLSPLARAAFWAREVDVDANDTDARLKLARALRDLGKYDEAAQAAEQILVRQPANYEALLEAARAKIAGNQGFYAIDDTQRAAALQPKDWRPVSLMAVALEQSERDDEALAAHQRALSLAPDNPAALSNLGMYYATHGQAPLAEPLLRKAIAEPGSTIVERQNLALVLGLEGRLDEAEHLQRQDLPPQMVDNNLAYLKADNDPARPHSWQSLRDAP